MIDLLKNKIQNTLFHCSNFYSVSFYDKFLKRLAFNNCKFKGN